MGRFITDRFKALQCWVHWLTACLVFTSWAIPFKWLEASEQFSEKEIAYFERQIRPLLVEHCYECHSANAEKVRGGLLLDTRDALRVGGVRGPAVVPGKLDVSLLIQAIRHDHPDLQMPPGGKLSVDQIAAFERWVVMGAPDPREGTSVDKTVATGLGIEEGRKFWSFQPVRQQRVDQVHLTDWPRRKIDLFILEKLEQRGLSPSPQATLRQLIRRATLNLTGLPPSSKELERLVAGNSPNAYPRLIERLLASHHYGEHWARFWLDKARYTDAPQFRDDPDGLPWLYRDWVIRALNEDVPYGEFVKRQLATDLMPSTTPDDIPALGFLGISPAYWKELKLDQSLIKGTIAKEWEERIDAVGRTFLGLTLACARCHDHKFDPIGQEDYYALAGVIASTRIVNRPLLSNHEWEVIRRAKEQVAPLTKKLTKLQEQETSTNEQKKEMAQLEAQIQQIKAATSNFDAALACAVEDASLHVLPDGPHKTKLDYRRGKPRDLHLHIRGNPSQLGPRVPRRFLAVLSESPPQPFSEGSGRLELAEAIFDEGASLAARVLVNRIWEQHFGQGLVITPSNFGVQGARPTHPRLLDDLAARFIFNDWSLKWLHREILLSATFQQSSQWDERQHAIDPENRMLWRMNRRSLAIEAWRDSMLAASGSLDDRIGGPPLPLTDLQNRRRSVYGLVDRRNLDTMLRLHDFPDPASHSPHRQTTTTPVQLLFVLNSPFIITQAERLYDHLQSFPSNNVEQRIEQVYQWLFHRPPSPQQVEWASEYIAGSAASGDAEAWKQYFQSLLASNEFLFID